MSKIEQLIARWNEDEGKPYKGELFDFDSYDGEGEPPLSCMCAQGQVLHVVAGWQPRDFRDADQSIADWEVAKLLNISRVHSVLLRSINDKQDGAPAIVLDLSDNGIGKVLGSEWSRLLDFWHHLDGLDARQRVAARDAAWDAARVAAGVAARDAAGVAARDAAWDAAGDAAWDAARVAARDAAWDAARVAAWDAAGVAAWASSEIQGASKLDKFFFLPAFGFTSPAEIPARPADYGVYSDV